MLFHHVSWSSPNKWMGTPRKSAIRIRAPAPIVTPGTVALTLPAGAPAGEKGIFAVSFSMLAPISPCS
jgi:hypothetical protein